MRSTSGFTLIELLVVIAIVAVLVTILLPVTAAGRQQARLVKVQMELRSIGVALEGYANDYRGHVPPGRTFCDAEKSQEWCELPMELVQQKWLPSGSADGRLSSVMEDEFNPGHTYKYNAPGWGWHNGFATPKCLWVPDTFPRDDATEDPETVVGRVYDNISRPALPDGPAALCPVKWVVWSLGPRYDPQEGSPLHAPIARSSWYRGPGTKGVIPRISPLDGEQYGWQ